MSQRPHTKEFTASARERLGLAVVRAREAAGYLARPAFVEPGFGITSLVKLETGKPVGPIVYEAVGRKLGQHFSDWNEDTPLAILRGGPLPANLPTGRAPEKQPEDELMAVLNKWERELSPEDFNEVVEAVVVRLMRDRRSRGA